MPTEQPAPEPSWAATPRCYDTSELKQSCAEVHFSFSLEMREQTQETFPCGVSGNCFAYLLPAPNKQGFVFGGLGVVPPPKPPPHLRGFKTTIKATCRKVSVMAMTSFFFSIYKNSISFVVNW